MGGGIYTYKCSSTITHNTISGNTASIGGGICCYVLDTDLISENLILSNSAVGDSGLGGGISCFHTYSGTITDNAIFDNFAWGGGGAIHLYLSNAIPGEDATISNNVIAGNTAAGDGLHRGGGGIMLEYYNKGAITGNLLAQNVAPNCGGGGIAFWQCTIPVSGNTFTRNNALAGGAVYAYSTTQVTVDVTNTICWADTGISAGNEIWAVGQALFNVTYCDVDGGHTGEGNIDCDPMFCYPDTGDYYLTESSCCVGAGEGGADIGAFGVGCPTVGCDYVAGDCDHNGTSLELGDVVTMIGMYRGTSDPEYACACPPHGDDFAPEADPNGNCVAFELGDVVTEIGAYRGMAEASGCPDCPGSLRLLLEKDQPLINPGLKANAPGAASAGR